jgi:DNA-binding IclR family transcriptional regulator
LVPQYSTGLHDVEQTSSIKILDKTLRLLSLFNAGCPEWGVTELAERSGLPKSTAYRILRVLLDHELLAQDPVSKRFRLGLGSLELGRRAYEGLDLRDVALPVLRLAAERSGETVTLQVLNTSRDRVVCVERVQQSSGLHLIMEVGNTAPLHAGASSRALLAFLPPTEIERVLEGPLEPLTIHTITKPALLRDELELVRSQGYAASFEETDLGAAGVAVPILNGHGAAIASLTIAGPVTRLNRDTYQTFVQLALDAAAEIGRAQTLREAFGAKTTSNGSAGTQKQPARRRADPAAVINI